MTARELAHLPLTPVGEMFADYAQDSSQLTLGTGGVEPFDREWGLQDYTGKRELSPFARVNRVRKRVFDTEQAVEEHRAVLITEGYEKFHRESQAIKCAKAVAYVFENLPINIWPDELIAGECAAAPRRGAVYPEYSVNWLMDELKGDRIAHRSEDRYATPPHVMKALLDLEDYWVGNTLEDEILGLLSPEEARGSHLGRPVFTPTICMYGGIGHTTLRFETLLQLGFRGRKKQVLDQLAQLDCTKGEDIEKREFYDSVLIMLDAATVYIKRYAQIAREQAAAELNEQRKAELLVMSENLEWISENPPRTFWQALQMTHLMMCMVFIEGNGQGIALGRFDQYLYPYYEADMLSGETTKTFVAELLELWCVKTFEMLKLHDEIGTALSSEAGYGLTTTIGGVGKNGLDATNDLSYLLLEAHAHTQMQEPWISTRWHENSPFEYKARIANVVKTGTGLPKIFNDDSIIPAQCGLGKSIQDARDYNVIGCVEIDMGGKEQGSHDSSYMSLPKVFEMALNHGRCVDCGPSCNRWSICGGVGDHLGPDYGGIDTYQSIEELKEAYRKQMEYWVAQMVSFINVTEIAHARFKPLPFLSAMQEGPIENGKDAIRGGAVYNFSGPQAVGMATVGDSMSTIRELIFKKKTLTPEQLLDALRKNWEGYEELYALVNSDKIPHYGNNDDYADELTIFAADCYIDAVSRYQNSRGGRMVPGLFSVSSNVGIGLGIGATPDGRLAYEPVSNCLGPVHTKVGFHDVTGPTAMATSASKVDQQRGCNGTLLNVRFSPNCVAGVTGRDTLVRYIDGYFRKKGFEVQFNIVNHQTLLNAQKNPEDYQGLLVRVAGYSALFVRLSKPLQDDLIGRNAYSSFD